ncbi:hypothetical protein [Moorena sp. SIO4G3]|uniref:hypothetical protein n=1 Tax=Moorena sp. SIO4G3 TaxID=2607821 RepID=UPI0025DA22CB|nr:hypothetical protein [Moorena sp. SIO4G3]
MNKKILLGFLLVLLLPVTACSPSSDSTSSSGNGAQVQSFTTGAILPSRPILTGRTKSSMLTGEDLEMLGLVFKVTVRRN